MILIQLLATMITAYHIIRMTIHQLLNDNYNSDDAREWYFFFYLLLTTSGCIVLDPTTDTVTHYNQDKDIAPMMMIMIVVVELIVIHNKEILHIIRTQPHRKRNRNRNETPKTNTVDNRHIWTNWYFRINTQSRTYTYTRIHGQNNYSILYLLFLKFRDWVLIFRSCVMIRI